MYLFDGVICRFLYSYDFSLVSVVRQIFISEKRMMIYKYARLGGKKFQCENLFHFPFPFNYLHYPFIPNK